MSEPEWLDENVVRAVHEEQLAEHGGPIGIRDPALLAAAYARPRHRAGFGEPDLCELAACYAFGIVRNHPLVDGNKRTALVVCELFLALNGAALAATDEDCVLRILALAAGGLTEAAFAEWLRVCVRPA